MNDPRILALVGAAFLVAGVFAPVVTLPFVGSMTFLAFGGLVAAYVLLMALAGAGLALAGQARMALWPALGALLMIVFKCYRLQVGLTDLRERAEAAAAALGPVRRIPVTADSIHIEWGWVVLLLGAFLMVYASLVARRRPSAPAPESAAGLDPGLRRGDG